jgi:hypothetical protein
LLLLVRNKKKQIMMSYRSYLLEKPLMVNERQFMELIIHSHYEQNHGSYMTDKIIKAIVQQIDQRNNFVPKLSGSIADKPNEYWQSFSEEPLFYNGKPHRLVWYWQSNKNIIWVLNCFRVPRKKYKYEKK